jgi:EAL domain-containing protein (putative c-di-GMP-specific phosphodiesterase class I)
VTAEVTTWTVKEALRRSRLWSDAGIDLPISLRVPSSELVRATFVNELRAVIDRAHVEPSRLLVKVSEADVMDASIHGVVGRLHDMGVGLAVTGFGTGYSSMVQLQRLPITEIRIDPSFVQRLVSSPEDRAIATSIVELAHTIGVPAVADGVETRETWSYLVSLGFDRAMGPLIGGSMTGDELEAWMRTPGWSSRVG